MENNDQSSLGISNLYGGYNTLNIISDISLSVPFGNVVSLFGPNGVGKTTLLNLISGLLIPTSGKIYLSDQNIVRDITNREPEYRSRLGICFIPENRGGVFRNLTVLENILIFQGQSGNNDQLDLLFNLFPVLKRKLNSVAGTLSGGEQQMLALSRAYLAHAKILLVDEISMGLAPRIVDDVLDSIRELANSGIGILLVEQFVGKAIELSDYVYVIIKGKIALEGKASSITKNDIAKAYFT